VTTDVFQIGNQRLGIVTETPTGEVDEVMAPVAPAETVAWVDGCLLEIQGTAMPGRIEDQSDTTRTNEVGWAFLPSTDGNVAAVDEQGNKVLVAFTAITSEKKLREFATGRDYELRGDAVFEVGKVPHVYAMCERQTG
jgi:hypothetical protein